MVQNRDARCIDPGQVTNDVRIAGIPLGRCVWRSFAVVLIACGSAAAAGIGLLNSITHENGRGAGIWGPRAFVWLMVLDGRTYFEASYGPPEKARRLAFAGFTGSSSELEEATDATFNGPASWEVNTTTSHFVVGRCAASLTSERAGEVSGVYVFAKCPSSVAVFICSLAPGGFAFRKLWLYGRKRRRIACGRCLTCGYDLRGSGERCSECGKARSAPSGHEVRGDLLIRRGNGERVISRAKPDLPK